MSDFKTNEKILDKIKKLLALGSSSNEAEATSAIAKANDLLTEYNLSISDIEYDKSSIIEEEYGNSEAFMQLYKKGLAVSASKYNYCGCLIYQKMKSISESGNKIYSQTIKIVGKPIDIQATKIMLDYLHDSINRLSKINGRSNPSTYKSGVAYRLCHRIDELILKKENTEQVNALMVVKNTEIFDYYKEVNAKETKLKSTKIDSGFINGYHDGDSISLNAQLQ